MNIAAVDIVLLVIVLILVIRCIIKGFVADIFSFLSIVGGIAVAFIFDTPLAGVIDSLFSHTRWNTIIAFLLIFITFYLVVKIFEGALVRLLDRLHLDKLDKALGLFLGLVEGLVVVIMLVYLADFLPFQPVQDALNESRIAAFINQVFSWVPGRVESSLEMII